MQEIAHIFPWNLTFSNNCNTTNHQFFGKLTHKKKNPKAVRTSSIMNGKPLGSFSCSVAGKFTISDRPHRCCFGSEGLAASRGVLFLFLLPQAMSEGMSIWGRDDGEYRGVASERLCGECGHKWRPEARFQKLGAEVEKQERIEKWGFEREWEMRGCGGVVEGEKRGEMKMGWIIG